MEPEGIKFRRVGLAGERIVAGYISNMRGGARCNKAHLGLCGISR